MRAQSLFQKLMSLVGAGALLAAAFSFVSTPALSQITGSKHDLTSTGGGTIKQTSTTEICVFCHTPHGASTTLQPLWNRIGGTAAGSFTTYTSSTLDSTALAPMGNSLACLSCHDGVTSLDNLINGSGSGNYNAAGAAQGYTWAGGVTAITGVANLTSDLTNDHPIGVAYCGGFAAGACRDPDFQLATATKQLNRSVGGVVTSGAAAAVAGSTTDQYWIDTTVGTANVRDKTDMILYPRAFTNPSGTFPSVECASCHEPHRVSSNATFLRIANTGSAVCLACHVK